mmetsp:Transcript_58533/g.97153  ORF Transcript_58533/g.97153 Transcript_58533/m.97153 type:complete len:208 (-) Transcript_58533:23-646(-)
MSFMAASLSRKDRPWLVGCGPCIDIIAARSSFMGRLYTRVGSSALKAWSAASCVVAGRKFRWLRWYVLAQWSGSSVSKGMLCSARRLRAHCMMAWRPLFQASRVSSSNACCCAALAVLWVCMNPTESLRPPATRPAPDVCMFIGSQTLSEIMVLRVECPAFLNWPEGYVFSNSLGGFFFHRSVSVLGIGRRCRMAAIVSWKTCIEKK